MDPGLFFLRWYVGTLIAAHGAQKLFGMFGGPGIAGFAKRLESMRLRHGTMWARVAGLVETGGGFLLVLGFLTPLAVAAVIGRVIAATVLVHWDKGFWNSNGGFEFPLTVAVAAWTLSFTGPGAWSIDALAGIVLAGWPYGIGTAAFGLVTAGIVVATRGREPEDSEGPTDEEPTET